MSRRKSPPEARIVRLLIARRRLMTSVAAGVILYLLLPASVRPVTRGLLAWDLTAAVYVVAALVMISRSTLETCHARAALYDEAADWIIMTLVVASAAASFVAVLAELSAVKAAHGSLWLNLGITAATVTLSWAFTHLIFTMHYASMYYRPLERGQDMGHRGGLEFPGHRAPDYRDFLYYSFVIGCATQTADVNTVSPEMRRVTLVHGVVSFAFNTAILALTINVGASLIS
jgi:uncharacterized membrane protein